MKHAGPTRREIGVRTAFNLLGPLTNPAGTARQVIGVGDPAAAPRIAEVARLLGTERTFVVYGDGVDELPLDGSGVLYDVDARRDRPDHRGPAVGRAARRGHGPLAGGTPDENARIVETILSGEPGVRRDVVTLNAGAALLVAGAVETLDDGVQRAALTIDAGLAAELLERLRAERRSAEAQKAAAPPEGAPA